MLLLQIPITRLFYFLALFQIGEQLVYTVSLFFIFIYLSCELISSCVKIYAESLSETGLCNTTQPIEDCYQIEFTGSGELSFTVESSKRSTIYYFGMVSCEIYSTEADVCSFCDF